MAVTVTGTNTAHLWSYFNRITLDRVTDTTVFMDIGEVAPLKQKYGKQVIWTKMANLTAITASGTEGTPPTPVALTSAQITAAVAQYKYAVQWSDIWEKSNANSDIGSAIQDIVGSHMQRSLDTITRDQLVAAIGTTKYSAAKTALSDLGPANSLTLSDVRLAKLTLEANNVEPHKSGYYVFVGHPNTLYDMKTDTATGGWIDVHKYTDSGNKSLFNAEVGECDGVKFKKTTLVSKTNSGTSSSAYAYTQFLFGYQPFGTVKLDDNSTTLIKKDFGSAGSADPADELATLAWKSYYVAAYFGNVSAVSDPDRAIILKSGRST